MPNYIVTHRVVQEFCQDDLLECHKNLVADLPRGMTWQASWYVPEQNHLIGHYEAPSADAIRQVLQESGVSHIFPILHIQEAVEITPEHYARKRRTVAHKQRVSAHRSRVVAHKK